MISDEIYHGLVYEGKEHSILEFADSAFVFNGFSKAYAMTGWRLGYVISPKPYVRALQKIQQNLFISANAFVQEAGVAALRDAGDDVIRMRGIYDERRRYMISRLRDCLLYTSDAADDLHCVDLGGRRIMKTKKKQHKHQIHGNML